MTKEVSEKNALNTLHLTYLLARLREVLPDHLGAELARALVLVELEDLRERVHVDDLERLGCLFC